MLQTGEKRREKGRESKPEEKDAEGLVNDQRVKMKKNILITGLPGTGKTTLVMKLSAALENLHPIGFYTTEIREGGERVGFELVSLAGRKGLLSHIDFQSAFRVGKYKVDVKGFEDFLDEIPFLDSPTRLIIIDEIGKMECLSARFRSLLKEILDSEKWLIATIAQKGGGPIAEMKKRRDTQLFTVTPTNRDALFSEIFQLFRF